MNSRTYDNRGQDSNSALLPGGCAAVYARFLMCFFFIFFRTDWLEEYKERHKNVWPEMLQSLRDTGWHNYSLFMHDDGLLFSYAETPDFEQALPGMAEKEVNVRWQAEMAELFEALDGKQPDESMLLLDEVFHVD